MSIKSFKEYGKSLYEAGESAGTMEVDKTSVEQARSYAEKEFKKAGQSLDDVMPNFDENFKLAKKILKSGTTKRKDMPVIEIEDVRKMQARLLHGDIDIKAPFYKEGKNPFPQGLSGKKAAEWMKWGIKDGKTEDDQIKVKNVMPSAKSLKPIQKQIYLSKAIEAIIGFGVKGSTYFLQKKSILVVSSDARIIDGHHRFLSALLIDPDMKLQAVSVDLPIKIFLPLALSYSDAVGNKRNA